MKTTLANIPFKPLLISLAVLGFASQAQACDFVCKAKREAEKIVNAGKNKAGEILRDAYAEARTTTDKANQQAAGITSAATQTVQTFRAKGAAISQAEYNRLASEAAAALPFSQSALTSLATTALTVAALDEATRANLRAASGAALNTHATKLLDLQARLNSLDAGNQQTLRRIMRAIPLGKIDSQSLCDVPRLAKKLGLLFGTGSETAFGEAVSAGTQYDQNIPGVPSALASSNFSLCLGGAGAYGAGANAAFCFAMEVTPSFMPNASGKRGYKMAVVETLGGSVGLGVGVGPSLGWSPGRINTQLTPTIGVQGSLGTFGMGLSWDVALKDMGAIPGFALGIGVGTPAAGTIDAGISLPLVSGYWTFSK